MSLHNYVKKKIVFLKNGLEVDLTRYVIDISTNKNFDITNNSSTVRVIDNDLLYDNGRFILEEGDIFFIYAKIISKSNDKELTDNDIIWNGKFVDYTRSESPDDKSLTLTIMDWGYDVFNAFHTESYSDGVLSASDIIKRIIKVATENDDGTFEIDTSNIATLRNDGSSFPLIEYSASSKPIFEWFQDLSSPNWINTETEIINNNRVIKYPMIIDFRGNKAFWFEQPLNTVLNINKNTPLIDISYNTANAESTNRLILDCGEDLDGEPIYIIVRDDNTNSQVTKDSFHHKVTISGKNNNYDNEYHVLRSKAFANGWDDIKFREEVTKLAESYSDTWFDTFGRKKPTITLTLPRVDTELGELVFVNRRRFPLGNYRVIRVTNEIGNEWSTTLEIESFDE